MRPGLNIAFLTVLAVAVIGYVRLSTLARLFVVAAAGLAVTNVLTSLTTSPAPWVADALFGLAASGLLATLILQRTRRLSDPRRWRHS